MIFVKVLNGQKPSEKEPTRQLTTTTNGTLENLKVARIFFPNQRPITKQ